MLADKKLDLRRKSLVTQVKIGPYRTVKCRMTRGLTKWCYGLCTPVKGHGACGRPAPHACKGRTQRAIARYKKSRRERSVSESPQ